MWRQVPHSGSSVSEKSAHSTRQLENTDEKPRWARLQRRRGSMSNPGKLPGGGNSRVWIWKIMYRSVSGYGIALTKPGVTSGKKKKKKNLPANAGDIRDTGSVPGSGRSPGEGNGNPLQHSCLGNPTDRGAWWTTARRIAKSQTRLKWLNAHAQRV